MSGKYSRDKGARNERALVEYFTKLGYPARRIPLSGAMEGFKGDVEIDLPMQKVHGELKSRKNVFGAVYGLLDGLFKGKAGIVSDGQSSILLSYHFDDLGFNYGTLDTPIYHKFNDKAWDKLVHKIAGFRKWLGGSAFLVIKDDYKRFIFIRFI